MATTAQSVADLCLAAREAARELAATDSVTRERALEAIADALVARTDEILEANARDMEAGREAGLTAALLDRLLLTPERIAAIAGGARQVAALPDPVGEIIGGGRLANGLEMQKLRVPLGVVAIVYEARPNVTIDAAVLCLKSGQRLRPARVLVGGALQRGARRDRRARPPRARDCPRARSRSSPAAGARSSPSSRPRRASST